MRIALTPLVDVVFILLLFFMLNSSFHRHHFTAIQSDRPQGLPTEQRQDAVVQLLVTEDGRVHYGGQSFALDGAELKSMIAQWLQAQTAITLGAERRASIQQLITALGVLTALGVDQLRLFPSVSLP